MFRLDEFLKEISDAKHAVGGQRHEDNDDRRYVSADHLLLVRQYNYTAATCAILQQSTQ